MLQTLYSEPFIGHPFLGQTMRKVIAVLLVALLIPAMPVVDADSNLLEVGVTDTIDGRFIHTSFSSSSTLLTLTTSGNLSEHFWGSGELITQWSIELNTTVHLDEWNKDIRIMLEEAGFYGKNGFRYVNQRQEKINAVR